MTAMVVLDAKLDMNETFVISESDVDTIKYSSSRVPVGAVLSRQALLELALMSSDNRAAAALARTYPGGNLAFRHAVKEKLVALEMHQSSIEEPTGLSHNNRSTAADLVKMVSAASAYPEISRISTSTDDLMDMNGRMVQYRNTNRLVGRDGWDILLSKTGFTNEAGKCLVMRFQASGKHLIMVLLNARESAGRFLDAENVQRFVTGQPLFVPKLAVAKPVRKARPAKSGIMLVKSKGGQARKKSHTM
jgi:D-alanyl-D-alanine carboxypeptidase/D-alanyl-D-alanine endopeptidase (penicillin-binding protein 7)